MNGSFSSLLIQSIVLFTFYACIYYTNIFIRLRPGKSASPSWHKMLALFVCIALLSSFFTALQYMFQSGSPPMSRIADAPAFFWRNLWWAIPGSLVYATLLATERNLKEPRRFLRNVVMLNFTGAPVLFFAERLFERPVAEGVFQLFYGALPLTSMAFSQKIPLALGGEPLSNLSNYIPFDLSQTFLCLVVALGFAMLVQWRKYKYRHGV